MVSLIYYFHNRFRDFFFSVIVGAANEAAPGAGPCVVGVPVASELDAFPPPSGTFALRFSKGVRAGREAAALWTWVCILARW